MKSKNSQGGADRIGTTITISRELLGKIDAFDAPGLELRSRSAKIAFLLGRAVLPGHTVKK